MRVDRDTFVLFLTLVPAAFVIYCFIVWHSTGTWPATVPNITLPAIPVPGWLARYTNVPPGTHSMLDRYRQSWPIMIAGLGAGLVLGIMAMGTFADLVRGGARWLSRQGQPEADDDDDAVTEPASPA